MTSVLHRDYSSSPPSAHSAKQSVIFADDRDSHIDLSAGAGVACLGHSASMIKATMIEQLHMLPYVHSASWTCEAVERAAHTLLSHMSPDFQKGRAVFYSGGAEAIEAACKIAMQLISFRHGRDSKPVFVGRRHSYHGNTMFTLALGDHRRRNVLDMQDSFDAGGFLKFDSYVDHDADHSLSSLQDVLCSMFKLGHPCIVVIEPVGGTAAGIAPPPHAYLDKVAEMVHAYGGVLIYDEILSGNYRTGSLNAYQHFASRFDTGPDIVVMGKGITGGYFPVSAVAVSEAVASRLTNAHGQKLWHTSTNQNNPIGCAAVFAALPLYRSNKAAHDELAGWCKRAANELSAMSHVKWVSGVGTLWGVRFSGNAATAAEIKRHMAAHGISVYTDGGLFDGREAMMLFAPPLGTGETDIKAAVKAIGAMHLTPVTHARLSDGPAGGSDAPALGA